MRFSGLVIFVLLIASIGFIYLGVSEPQFSFRTQTSVGASTELTHSAFTDTARMSVWVSDLVKVDLLRGDQGADDSFYRLTFVRDGQDVIATQHLIASEVGARVAYDVEFPNMNTAVEVLFEPTTQGTRVTTYNTVRGKGVYWQAMLQLNKAAIIEQQQADYRRFKAMLESPN